MAETPPRFPAVRTASASSAERFDDFFGSGTRPLQFDRPAVEGELDSARPFARQLDVDDPEHEAYEEGREGDHEIPRTPRSTDSFDPREACQTVVPPSRSRDPAFSGLVAEQVQHRLNVGDLVARGSPESAARDLHLVEPLPVREADDRHPAPGELGVDLLAR